MSGTHGSTYLLGILKIGFKLEIKGMKYVGSKNRLSKYLAPIIQGFIESAQAITYIEPFVGGCNMIDKIKCRSRIGGDIHKYLIALWKALQDGRVPPDTISEGEYIRVRDNKSRCTDSYVGLVGFCATYGSKWFGGYARGFKEDKVTPRDIPAEAIRNIMRQVPKIQDVEFHHCNYWQFLANGRTVIYCDPPYQAPTKYSGTSEFDYKEFWCWCRESSRLGTVLVSEYNAPDDFECIWQKEHKTSLDTHRHHNRTEKLFRYRG